MKRMLLMTVMACALAFSTAVTAQSNRATFPKNFDQYVRYAVYDRGSSKEEAFALPETISLSRAGKPLPAGTQLVLGIWNNNSLTDYFVMEKGAGWGLENREEMRTGDWHFQQFDPARKVRRTGFAERCQSCHQGAASTDYMFTLDRMRAYLP